MTRRIAVLASGNGSNFQALVDATRPTANDRLDAVVAGIVCNVPGAYVLTRAAAAGVAATVLPIERGEPRPAYDRRLADAVAAFEPDYIVLAGWMRLLSMSFLGRFPNRVINLHPALPGEFPGTAAIERAFAASREQGLTRTGVMVHFVPDEGVDDGPVIRAAEVAIAAEDTLESLSERVHAVERALLVESLRDLLDR